jgi:hypothetical protein
MSLATHAPTLNVNSTSTSRESTCVFSNLASALILFFSPDLQIAGLFRIPELLDSLPLAPPLSGKSVTLMSHRQNSFVLSVFVLQQSTVSAKLRLQFDITFTARQHDHPGHPRVQLSLPALLAFPISADRMHTANSARLHARLIKFLEAKFGCSGRKIWIRHCDIAAFRVLRKYSNRVIWHTICSKKFAPIDPD